MFFGGNRSCNGVGVGFQSSFFCVLVNLLNFRVLVTTEGSDNDIRGLLVAVGCNFITINTDDGGVAYVPIRQITSIQRLVHSKHCLSD